MAATPDEMRHSEGSFSGAGGLELYSQQWLPETDARAVVLLVHGVGEHSARYMNMVRPVVLAGHAVYSYDHRGHGRSPGRRVHIEHWTQYRDDLAAYLRLVTEREAGRPIVVYGHSMGSLVALDFLIQKPDGVTAAIISGVAIEPAGVGSPIQIVLAKTLSGVLPKLSVDLGIAATSLSRDPAALEAFTNDPKVTGRATVRWGAESLAAVERVKAGMGKVDLPVLVLHGKDDPLNRVEGARALYEALPHHDKQLKLYSGALHEPHNDLCHAELARDVVAWLDHIAQAVEGASDGQERG